MKKYLLLALSVFIFVFIQAQSQQEILRAQLQPASDNVYHYPNGKHEQRSNRSVIFYDDFSSPSNWTMTNASSPAYDWEIINTFPANLSSQNFGPNVNSTSGGNFALVNSDAQGGSASQNCNLTNANPIDCSTHSDIRLTFENYHKIYDDTHIVLVSNDGVNFDPYPVNTNYGIAVNYSTSPNTEKYILDISATASMQPTVWIRFNYIGSWNWFWAIDDVTVEDIPPYEITTQNIGYCDVQPELFIDQRIEHAIVPADQVRALKIMGDLKSGGSVTTNSYLKVEIFDGSSNLLFSDSTAANTLSPMTWRTDSILTPIISGIDNYTIKVSAIADSANIPVTSYQEQLNYTVSDNSTSPNSVFARDNDTYTTDGIWNGPFGSYMLGNEFMVENNMTIYGISVALTSATDPGAVICAMLYEYDSTSFPFGFAPVVDNCINGIEYTVTANDISGNNQIKWINLYFDQPYVLQGGNAYVAFVNTYGGLEDVVIMQGGNTIHDAATVWIYDPTATTGGPWFYVTKIPMIRFKLSPSTLDISEKTANNIQVQQNYPNPADEMTSIIYNLESAEYVSFDIMDITGKIIYSENLGIQNPGQHAFELNTKDFASGIYFYKVSAGKENVTLKMIVEK
jgi:hypothetical protein